MTIPEVKSYELRQAGGQLRSVVDLALRSERAVLLAHDMQEYFLSSFPSNTSLVAELGENCGRIRDICGGLSIPVVYMAQPGSMTVAERGLLMDFWGSGRSASERYSDAFSRTGLLDFQGAEGRDQLIVCGVYANVGGLMTTADALSSTARPKR